VKTFHCLGPSGTVKEIPAIYSKATLDAVMKRFVMSLSLLLVPALQASLHANGAFAPRADLEAGRYLKVLADSEAQLRQNPGNALAWAAKAQALLAMQRVGEALAAAQKAVDLNGGLADALLARGMARAGVAVQQRNLSSFRNISGGLSDMEAAVKADPTLASGWMTLGIAYQTLPGLMGGSTRKALQCADNLRRLNPPRGDVLQGTILSMAGRWNEAVPYFGRALALAPADPDGVYGYLDALGSRETRNALGAAEQKRREAAEAWRLLPNVRHRAKAIEAITDALLEADQPENAWTIATQALPQADFPSLVRLQLGKLAAKSGLHRQEGLTHLDQVLHEPLEGGSGGYPAAWWRKAQILKDLGRKDEARSAAQAALRLDSKHSGARKILDND